MAVNEHLKMASCKLCGSQERIYICEQGHKNLFCKACLIGTYTQGNSKLFKAKCTSRGGCNYSPLNPGGVGLYATNPYA